MQLAMRRDVEHWLGGLPNSEDIFQIEADQVSIVTETRLRFMPASDEAALR